MKKMIAFRLSALLLAVFLIVGLTACGNKSDTSATTAELKEINIGFPSAGGDFPGGIFGIAIANGYLDEYLKPLGYVSKPRGFVGAAPAIHEALVAEELDYVVYAGMASDLSKANGIDHTLISVTGYSPNWALVVRADANINTLTDLKGKKMAYQRGASPHMYAIRVLAEAGLTFDDIQPLNTTIPEGIAGITSGDIDAAVVTSAQTLSLVADGTAKVLHNGFADEYVTEYSEPSVFIARTTFHKENPEVAVAIQKAFLKAKEWALEDTERYFNLQAEKLGQTIEYVKASSLADIDAATPLNLENQYIDSLREILEFLKQNDLTTGDIDFDTWLDKSVVTKAAEEYANGE